jgi:hypothetical protein
MAVGTPLAQEAGAETFSTCNAFVTTVPFTIGSSGTWCLQQDLATSIGTGAAIQINVNNVTLDCNGHRLGGLSAGPATNARGIRAQDRQNVTIRNCAVRGFWRGIEIQGGRSLVEDNVLDKNTRDGIFVIAGDGSTPEAPEGSLVRRNQVLDTAGIDVSTAGITAGGQVHVVDNVISTVSAGTAIAKGIVTTHQTGSVSGNRISGLLSSGTIRAIEVLQGGRVVVSGNHLFGAGAGTGMWCQAFPGSVIRARDNTIVGFATGITTCGDAGGNDVAP